MGLLRKVQNTIQRHELIRSGDRVVVAVSGGADSVALLRALHSLREELGFEVHAAHLNHGLRGKASDADARFVRRLCGELGVPVQAAKCDVAAQAAGQSLEAAAREARYRFLERVWADVGGDRIAVGHTADDQVETVLLNLIRGAGTLGLAGMPPAGPGPVVRPLIECTRAEVLEYLEEIQQSFREDPTNRDVRYLRNRIRHELLPLLEERYSAGIRDVLLRMAGLARGDWEVLSAAGRVFLKQARMDDAQGEGKVVVSIERLNELPIGAQRLVVREACREAAGSAADLAASHVEGVVRLAARGALNRSVWLPPGVVVSVRREGLTFEARAKPPAEAEAAGSEMPRVELAVPGTVELPRGRGRLTVELIGGSAARELRSSDDQMVAVLDADKVALPLSARGWESGDRMRPLGMGGRRKKLKKLFQEAGVSLEERRQAVVVTDGADEVVWVAGLRIGEWARVTDATERALRLRLVAGQDS